MAESVAPHYLLPNLPVPTSFAPPDGTLGLGLSQETSAVRDDSYFASLAKSGGIGSYNGLAVMGFYLADTNASLVIGGTDTSKFSGQLDYTNVETPVSTFRGVPCPRSSRTRYRFFGRSTWVLCQSMEMSPLPLRKQLLTWPTSLSPVTVRPSAVSIKISPVRSRFYTLAAFGVVRLSRAYLGATTDLRANDSSMQLQRECGHYPRRKFVQFPLLENWRRPQRHSSYRPRGPLLRSFRHTR